MDVKNPAAARRAVHAVTEAAFSLREHPERGRRGPDGPLRELSVPFGKDGYVIRYRIAPSEVVIARIYHARERR